MKNSRNIVSKIICAAALCGTVSAFAMDENGWASIYESIGAFDSNIPVYGGRSGYVQPIISKLGNVLNSNWYVSANVPESFTFEAGLPFSLIPVGDDDKTFNEKNALGTSAKVPTIFGDHYAVGDGYAPGTVYGNETLNGLGVFTYPYLQLAAGYYHARVVLRGMWLPAISELQGFSELGFGLQYSFGHFFQYMLPPAAQGLDVSLVFGYNSSSISYQPEDYEGSLDLDVSALTFDVVIGYKPISLVEIMMTLGYQNASMESSGHLVSHAKGSEGAQINPNISVDGNCGFKFGLAVAFQLGSSFHPVIGYDHAGESSFTTNVLYFRQQFGTDKTPDEIAKEKGYVRNGASESVKNESSEEDTPKAKKKKKLKNRHAEEEDSESDQEEPNVQSSKSTEQSSDDDSEFEDF